MGVAQQIQARGPLGFYGNFVPVAYINVFAGIGWAAVTVILGAQAAHALAPRDPVLAGGARAGVGAVGSRDIRLQHDSLLAAHPRGRALHRLLGDHRRLRPPRGYQVRSAAIRPPPTGSQRRWLGDLRGVLPVVSHRVVAVRLGLLALSAGPGWGGQPGRRPVDCRRELRLAVMAGHRRGAILGGSAATGGESPPIEALQRLTGPFAIPALLTVLLSSFSQNFLNVYGGAISIQTLRIPVSRRTAVIFICAIAFLISLWADENFESKFKTFLFLGAYLIAPPFGAVLLLDYVLNRRHERIAELYDSSRILEWGFVAWLVGAVASIPFWQLSFYTGPVSVAHPEWGRSHLLRRIRRRGSGFRGHVPSAAPPVASEPARCQSPPRRRGIPGLQGAKLTSLPPI